MTARTKFTWLIAAGTTLAVVITNITIWGVGAALRRAGE